MKSKEKKKKTRKVTPSVLGSLVRLTASFSSEMMEVTRQWDHMLKVLKEEEEEEEEENINFELSIWQNSLKN